MKIHHIAALIALTTPALADTPNAVTLTMENEAAGVINVPDMTQRECNAAAALLSARSSGNYGVINYGGYTTDPASSRNGYISIGPSYTQSSPTTNLRTAKCVVPTATKP